MSQACKTLPMPPQGDSTPLPASCSITSPSPPTSALFSSMSDLGETTKGAVLKHLTRMRGTMEEVVPATSPDRREAKCRKPFDARPRELPLPPASLPSDKRPAPYPQISLPHPPNSAHIALRRIGSGCGSQPPFRRTLVSLCLVTWSADGSRTPWFMHGARM